MQPDGYYEKLVPEVPFQKIYVQITTMIRLSVILEYNIYESYLFNTFAFFVLFTQKLRTKACHYINQPTPLFFTKKNQKDIDHLRH